MYEKHKGPTITRLKKQVGWKMWKTLSSVEQETFIHAASIQERSKERNKVTGRFTSKDKKTIADQTMLDDIILDLDKVHKRTAVNLSLKEWAAVGKSTVGKCVDTNCCAKDAKQITPATLLSTAVYSDSVSTKTANKNQEGDPNDFKSTHKDTNQHIRARCRATSGQL